MNSYPLWVFLNTNLEILPATHATAILIFILSLLFLTAIAAGAEVAFFTLTNKDINYLKTKETHSAKKVVHLLEAPELLSASLRVAKITFSIAIIIAGNYLANLFIPIQEYVALTFIVIFLGITFILLLFGEMLPKVYARQNNVRFTLFAGNIVEMLCSLFSGLGKAFMITTTRKYSEKELNKLKMEENKDFAEAIMLSLGHEATQNEIDIYKGILKFNAITVKQIMQPRLDISGINETWSFDKVKEKIVKTGYTRMPVYRNNIDEIIGKLNTKDLIPYIDIPDFDWHSVIRPVYFVFEHKRIDELLSELQERRNKMAIVVDEFGGTSGVVTLEDIIEEIVGDIRDEFDEDDKKYTKVDDNTYIFDGKISIIDLCRIVGVKYDYFDEVKGESDSLGGLLLEISEKFFSEGDKVFYKQFEFTINSINGFRITQIEVKKNEEKEV
jgi:putative hemolysin